MQSTQLLPLLKSVKKKDSKIDNFVFWLHYRVTCVLLLICAAFTTMYQFIGIKCDVKGVKLALFESYCWSEGIYTEDTSGKHYLGWYQWVSLTLAAQALMFYLPHYIWKLAENGQIGLMVNGMDKKTLLPPKDRAEKRSASAKYFIQMLGSHQAYFAKYVVCEIVNFINVFAQVYLINMFLNGKFTQFGANVLMTQSSDPLAKVFPKMAMCTFKYEHGLDGDEVDKQGYCYLGINTVNEKIYIFLWFYLHGLMVVTAIYLVYRLCTIASLKLRYVKVCLH